MIKPIDATDHANYDFAATDIENDKTGKVLAIGTSWRFNGEIQHCVWNNWGEWWEWISDQAKTCKQFRTIYAHNGGGWDWCSFLEWLLANKNKDNRLSVSVVSAQSKMILMDITLLREPWEPGCGRQMKSRLRIRLCDSLYLLRSALGSKVNPVTGKKSKGLLAILLGDEWDKTEERIEDVWNAWENDKPRFYRYLKRDCDGLLMVLENSLKLIREKVAKIGKLGVTIGSTALKIYRTMGMRDFQDGITIPENEEHRAFLREGYRGGRVEVFRYGYHKEIWCYDVNSLYPSAMVNTPVPVSDRMQSTRKYHPKTPGVYRIEWKQNNRNIHPVIMVDGRGRYEGSGVIYNPEIDMLLEADPTAEIRLIGEGYVFPDFGYPFRHYVQTLYDLRKSDPDGPISLLAKYCLNSLYGKFGEKRRRKKLVIYRDWDEALIENEKLRQKGLAVRTVSESSLLYEVEVDCEVKHEHCGIAGMITSGARTILYRYMMRCGNELVYTDTDSLHCTTPILSDCVGNDFGMVKLEGSGEGIYCGKKIYGLRKSGQSKIRLKGVSVGGANGFDFRWEHLQQMVNGATVDCVFSQPATVKSIASGKEKSCRLGTNNRKRRVKMTGENIP